jgi:hypothetical protein
MKVRIFWMSRVRAFASFELLNSLGSLPDFIRVIRVIRGFFAVT